MKLLLCVALFALLGVALSAGPKEPETKPIPLTDSKLKVAVAGVKQRIFFELGILRYNEVQLISAGRPVKSKEPIDFIIKFNVVSNADKEIIFRNCKSRIFLSLDKDENDQDEYLLKGEERVDRVVCKKE